MSWIGRLVERAGKAALDHVRQTPAFGELERQNRLANPIVTVARLLAGSPAGDEILARRLRARFKDREAAEFALHQLEGSRSEFLDDRAYRLLYAAANDVPVPAVDLHAEASLTAQERLGRLPLRDAFASVAEHAPGLRVLEAQVTDSSWREDELRSDLQAYVIDQVSEVLEVDSERYPVHGSQIARLIASHYLLLISGEETFGDLDSPVLPEDDVPI